MAKAIEEVDYNQLKRATKALNDSGKLEEPIKIIATTKPKLIELLTAGIESLPEGDELPKDTIDWYNEMYADEFGGEEDEQEESTAVVEENEQEASATETIQEQSVESKGSELSGKENQDTDAEAVEETESRGTESVGEDQQEEVVNSKADTEEPIVRDPETGERLEPNGLLCPDCGTDQYDSSDGPVCINGHKNKGLTEEEYDAQFEGEDSGLEESPEAIQREEEAKQKEIDDAKAKKEAEAKKIADKRAEEDRIAAEKQAELDKIAQDDTYFDTKTTIEMLKRAKSGLAKNSHIDDRLRVTLTGTEARSYNGHTCITQPFRTGVKASIRVDDFLGVLSKIKSKTFTMKSEDNFVTLETEDGTSAGFNATTQRSLMDSAEDIEMGEDLEWKDVPEDFIRGCNLVRTAADRKTFEALSCMYVSGFDMVCSDKVRISIYMMAHQMDKFMIKAEAVDELVTFDPKKYLRHDGWIHFKTDDDIIFSTKIIQAKFVDYKRYRKMAEDAPEICEIPKKFRTTVKAAAVMGDAVQIKVADGEITCTSKGDRGWVTKTMEIEHEGDAELKINPKLLTTALEKDSFMLGEIPDKAMVLTTDRFIHCVAVTI